ncbi:MAG: hypothetical protein JXA58_00825, partial [Dehalococcoidia bacterium]|nr:hypothetical protein [Dehalococcoidia bacterium]
MTQPDPVEVLQNILTLEAKKNCADSAVIGGLDAYLANAGSNLPKWFAPLLDSVRGAPGGYRGWNQQEREAWVADALGLLRNPHSDGPPPELQPITALTRVSTKTALLFAHLGVHTVNDLLYLLPRRYLDYTQMRTIAELRPF